MKSNKAKWNVLVFPGGTEIGLEIGKSLGMCKEVNLISASAKGFNHSDFFFETNYIVDSVIDSTNFIQQLNKIIAESEIDFLLPANPIVIDKITEIRSDLKCKIILTKNELIKITRSKNKTYELLQGTIPIPKTYKNIESIVDWPVHVKPNDSYGSQGTFVAESSKEIQSRYKDLNSLIIQEYLTGSEFTIDCFSDLKGKLLFSGPRVRERIRMGTTMHSFVPDISISNELVNFAKKISEIIPITGAWFFQVKADRNGDLKLLEVEARIAGTMCFNRVKGVNFPLLDILQNAGHDVGLLINDYNVVLDRALINRYQTNIIYDVVYIDLDDTIVIKEKINLSVIKFLYQCINEGKKLILISKSNEIDKLRFLEKYRIRQLFDEIIWLKEDDSKADFIRHERSIFIDDSFSQRLVVCQQLGIYTFDTSMIELLINDKI